MIGSGPACTTPHLQLQAFKTVCEHAHTLVQVRVVPLCSDVKQGNEALRHGFMLAHVMGLGKTLTTLAFLRMWVPCCVTHALAPCAGFGCLRVKALDSLLRNAAAGTAAGVQQTRPLQL